MKLFQIIYALIAMSMIKPAEKFIRDLFKMNGRIANTASFESGKMLMDATARLIKDLAATVSAAAATGGTTLAMKGAKTVSDVSQTLDSINQAPSLNEANGNAANETSNSGVTGENNENVAGNSNGDNADNTAVNNNNENQNDTTNTTTPSEKEVLDMDKLTSPRRSLLERSKERLLNTRLGATAGALFSSEGVENLMRVRGSLHGFQDAMGAGLGGGPGDWQHGVLAQSIMEMNKKKNKDAVDEMGSNSELLKREAEKYYQTRFKGVYNYNEKRERNAAEEYAKSKIKSNAEKYIPYGITDYDQILQLEAFAKKENISGVDNIIARYNKTNEAQKQREQYMESLREERRRTREENIEDYIERNSNNPIVREWGARREDNAARRVRVQENRALEFREQQERRNTEIFNKIKMEIKYEMAQNGGTYRIKGEDGNEIVVTSANIDSAEVTQAIEVKIPYVNEYKGKDVEVQIDSSDMKYLDRLQETKKTLADNNIKFKENEIQSLMNFDSIADRMMHMYKGNRNVEINHIQDSTIRKALRAEINRREAKNGNDNNNA